jgi:hypothetical protein
MLTFLAAVLPIAARSELYLYMPVFGLCVVAGQAADAWHWPASRSAGLLLITAIAALAAFQLSRSAALHRDLVFSAALTRALSDSHEIQEHHGRVLIAGADPDTQHLLQDSVAGYLELILKRIGDPDGLNQADTAAPRVRLLCTYDNGRVSLSRAP